MPEKSVAIEILETEKLSNIEEKAKKYGCRVIAINSLQELDIDFVEKAIN